MSKSPKYLIGAFLASAIFLTMCAVWTSRATADTMDKDAIAEETNAPQFPEIKEAFDRFIKRDLKGTKKILEAAVKDHPELPPMEVLMAEFYLAARQPQGVRPWLQKAVTEHPEDPAAYIMMGRLDAKSGLTVEAWLLLEKANTLMAKAKLGEKQKKNMQTAINSQLAQLAMMRENWEEAKKYLYELLNEDAANVVALQLLAGVFFEEGNTEKALDKLLNAKSVAQREGKPMLTPQALMGQWYEKKKDRRNATEMMKKAIEAAPDDFLTRLAVADWAFRTKQFKEAGKEAEKALALARSQKKELKDLIETLLLAGNIAIFNKDYDAAEKYLREAWEKAPSNFHVSNNFALVLCEQDDKDKLSKALNLAQINAQINQNEPEAFSTMGRVLYKSDRLKEAEQYLAQAINIARKTGKGISPDTAYYLAVIYADTNRVKEAKETLRKALDSEGLFSQREAAEKRLQQLNAK